MTLVSAQCQYSCTMHIKLKCTSDKLKWTDILVSQHSTHSLKVNAETMLLEDLLPCLHYSILYKHGLWVLSPPTLTITAECCWWEGPSADPVPRPRPALGGNSAPESEPGCRAQLARLRQLGRATPRSAQSTQLFLCSPDNDNCRQTAWLPPPARRHRTNRPSLFEQSYAAISLYNLLANSLVCLC